MVSLRRRRLLGLCSGLPNSSIVPFPMYFDDEGVAQFGTNPANSLPTASTVKKQNKEIGNSSSMLASNSTRQSNTKNGYDSTSSHQQLHDQPSPEEEAKIIRRQRRKHTLEQERRALRGVYFKNMKWQAAIKVDKKQIHLGTVGSQAEATRLYDRAAFMCGREPNLELPEEEKRELKRLEWDEFLEKTRLQISSKKVRRRRSGSGLKDKFELSVQELCYETSQGTEGALVADLEEAIF